MTFAELEYLTRREISDEIGDDTSWFIRSDQMLSYANEAEYEACRRARLLVDSTTAAICQIATVAGTAVYPYDSRIIFIRRGIMTGATRPLVRHSHTMMDEQVIGWESLSGEVTAFVTGMHSRNLLLYKMPTASGTLNLTVIRGPLQQFTAYGSPEIPERFHPALIHWMKHKAYNNQDSEMFDKNRADVHLATFEKYFGQRCMVDDVFDEMPLVRCDASGHYGCCADSDYF